MAELDEELAEGVSNIVPSSSGGRESAQMKRVGPGTINVDGGGGGGLSRGGVANIIVG